MMGFGCRLRQQNNGPETRSYTSLPEIRHIGPGLRRILENLSPGLRRAPLANSLPVTLPLQAIALPGVPGPFPHRIAHKFRRANGQGMFPGRHSGSPSRLAQADCARCADVPHENRHRPPATDSSRESGCGYPWRAFATKFRPSPL